VTLPAAVLLGIIQGLTEFLPVSSSAHLILARFFFGWTLPAPIALAFDVALHIGTLAAILTFFRNELAAMARSLPAAWSRNPGESGRLIQLIVVGTLPIVVVGLLFTGFIEDHLRVPAVAAAALVTGALGMMIAERLGPRVRDVGTLRWVDAVLIGCAQAAALVPGMSRSGSTIAVAMFLGMRRDAAARFTFLLAIPATAAAAGKEALGLRDTGLPEGTAALFVVGILVSGLVGYLTIKYFLRFLAGHRLDAFAYYRFALAALTVVWLWRS
jgi:undecaprenyl-diphosphatase